MHDSGRQKTEKSVITIIGAGLTGCFMAILLAKRGYKVAIYERASQAELINPPSRRTFNLTFRGFGEKVLRVEGLWEKLLPHMLPLEGFLTQTGRNSPPIYTAINREKAPCYTIVRARLLEVLLKEALSYANVAAHFGTALAEANASEKILRFENEQTKEISVVSAEVVLGTDGVHSVSRKWMQLDRMAVHSQQYADWGYKQIDLTPDLTRKLGWQENVAHTWSRAEAVLISHPSPGEARAAILVLPKGEGKGFSALTSPVAVQAFVERQFPVLLPVLSAVIHDVLRNPEGSFVTVHTSPWHYKNFMAILGDAAHGFYPFFGQGVSAGLGDCLELAALLDAHGNDFERIFSLYEKNRKPHMDALGELSKQGFALYRRARRADYQSIYERFESLLHGFFPGLVPPPLHDQISNDPGQTADYVAQHEKLRRVTKFLGIPIAVALVTVLVAGYEAVSGWIIRPSRNKQIA